MPFAAPDPIEIIGEPSEDAFARAFTAKFRDQLRYDHLMGKWFEWDGMRWKKNETKLAFHYARQFAKTLANGDESKFCRASVAGGVERFAQADPAHAVTSEIWDADDWLLGTPDGTLDLRTGQTRRAMPDDYISKLTTVSPKAGKPERWLRFLKDATNNQDELVCFLQRIAGYCLTGVTSEHALFFIYGPGGNGKSVFLNLLIYILGDYAATASMDTFTASQGDRHPTDMAMLAGSRLVTASETEEGRAWAESRIKSLTGGDPVTARFMRQDFFTYVPNFKLLIVGNHAPALANVDEAARRRFNIVPFVHQPKNPDKELVEKLKLEAGQILQWAIEGCLDWQVNGLIRPEIVTSATDEYFQSQDIVGQWLDTRCILGARNFEHPLPLYKNWQLFCQENGEDAGSQKSFAGQLVRHGIMRRGPKVKGNVPYRGVELLQSPPSRRNEDG